MLWSATP